MSIRTRLNLYYTTMPRGESLVRYPPPPARQPVLVPVQRRGLRDAELCGRHQLREWDDRLYPDRGGHRQEQRRNVYLPVQSDRLPDSLL